MASIKIEAQYIQPPRDHGKEGFLVKTRHKTYTFTHPAEIAFMKELFLGEQPVKYFQEKYAREANSLYADKDSHEKILSEFLLLLPPDFPIKRQRTTSVFPIINHLIDIDAATPEEYEYKVQQLLTMIPDENLALSHTGLGDKAINALGKLLQAPKKSTSPFFQPLPPVISLNLTSNHLSKAVCQTLASGIACCPALTTLKISDNFLEDTGFSWITQALEKHPSLKWLEAIACGLTDSAMQSLCDLLANNKIIESVNLRENNITDKGLGMILEVAQSHPSLKEICISMHNISDSLRRELEENLQHKITRTCSV